MANITTHEILKSQIEALRTTIYSIESS